MKRNFLITSLLITLIAISSFAQEYVVQVKPMDTRDWGYVNLEGDYILNPQFRKCFSFSEDGYAVIYEKKTGYYFINTKGEVLQAEIFNYHLIEAFGFGVQGFANGFVPVFVDGGWGYMNIEGKLAIPAKYDKVSSFKNGYGIAQKVIGGDMHDDDDLYSGTKGEIQFYIIDKKGNQKLVNVPNIKEIKWFSEGIAPFKTIEGFYGFLNSNGEVIIEPQFLSVGYFNEGLAWAKTNNKTIGYLNTEGEWIIKPQFKKANDFETESGMARVMQEKEWEYINTTGDINTFSDSEYISAFHDGLAKGKKDDKLGFYNNKLEWVIEPQFEGVRNFKNGYAAVKSNGAWGLIDKQGNWVIQPTFAAIKDVVKIN